MHAPRDAGFTLIEVLVAAAILAIVAGGVALAAAIPARALVRTRAETIAVLCGSERIEQLRSLGWGWGSRYAPRAEADTSTSLSRAVPDGSGAGIGLGAATLESDTPGQVDYLDASGRWIGEDITAGARFVRRWSIVPLPGASQALRIAVRVIDLRGIAADVNLVTVKARVAG